MAKLNCWQVKECGREPGGATEAELGPCPASTESRLDGVYGGRNGGRCCWLVAGTLCKGEVQGTNAKKIATCRECEFAKQVFKEERGKLIPTRDLLDRIA